MNDILKDMLLITSNQSFLLAKEMHGLALYFIMPGFLIALVIEYFNEWDFLGVIKKLVIILLFLGFYPPIHQKAVDLSLSSAGQILKKISPRNLFVKKWVEAKVDTKEKSNWNFLEKFAIPNLNDILGTALFIFSKIFLWLLKLIYSTVFHLTSVFIPIAGVLSFIPITNRAANGIVLSTIWCVILPFVVVGILALVGNSVSESALRGEMALLKVENLVWLFGITFILLLSPVITLMLIRGDGLASAGSNIGSMFSEQGMKLVRFIPQLKGRF
jgi:hypothetical protein